MEPKTECTPKFAQVSVFGSINNDPFLKNLCHYVFILISQQIPYQLHHVVCCVCFMCHAIHGAIRCDAGFLLMSAAQLVQPSIAF